MKVPVPMTQMALVDVIVGERYVFVPGAHFASSSAWLMRPSGAQPPVAANTIVDQKQALECQDQSQGVSTLNARITF